MKPLAYALLGTIALASAAIITGLVMGWSTVCHA